MVFPNTCKLSEFPLNSSLKPPLRFFRSFPIRTLTTFASLPNPKSNVSAPWLSKSPSPKTLIADDDTIHRKPDVKSHNTVDRMVLGLLNLGLPSKQEQEEVSSVVTGEERLGDLLRREWVRPNNNTLVSEDNELNSETVLPWEREVVVVVSEGEYGLRKRRLRAPTMAELTLDEELLRRLRREGMRVRERERERVPKAGLTQEVMDKIHKRWRNDELVRLTYL